MDNNNNTLIPPADFSDEEITIWFRVVDSLEPGWITETQVDLLTAYCRHVAFADEYAAAIHEARTDRMGLDMIEYFKHRDRLSKMFEREVRSASSLATRLRITNQSLRSDKAGSASGRQSAGMMPWEDSCDDE